MKPKVKPFTLFLWLCLVLLFILSPIIVSKLRTPIEPLEPLMPDKPAWTGIITIWDIPYIKTGTGSSISWINKHVRQFEKAHPGVFVDIKSMTPERASMYFQQGADRDLLPDIVSLSPYEEIVPSDMLIDIMPYFKTQLKDMDALALAQVVDGKNMKGLPYMLGGYGLFLNTDILNAKDIEIETDVEIDAKTLENLSKTLTYKVKEGKREIEYYGLCTYKDRYSNPLVNIEGMPSIKVYPSYYDAWEVFGKSKRSAMMLANTRAVYNIRSSDKLSDANIEVIPLSVLERDGLFNDQIGVYGLLKQDETEKEKICIEFFKWLMNNEIQESLKEIGMFPVSKGTGYIYEDDFFMHTIEDSLKRYDFCPNGQKGDVADKAKIE